MYMMYTCSYIYIYIPIQVSKVIIIIYIAINTHRTGNTADSYNMPIPPGRKNSCFSRSTLQCLHFRMAFADVRGTLIPEVSACKICRDGKLHMA